MDAVSIVTCAHAFYTQSCELTALQVLHSYFRQRDLSSNSLFSPFLTGIPLPLEHPSITEIYHSFVLQGDIEMTERHLFHFHAVQYRYFKAVPGVFQCSPWVRIEQALPNGHHLPLSSPPFLLLNNAWPSPRAGHQMVLDNSHRRIYLFGGFDGTQDLSDLWQYHLEEGLWTCLSQGHEAADGGPSPRSCHQMCMDVKRQRLYVIGRYIDGNDVMSVIVPFHLGFYLLQLIQTNPPILRRNHFSSFAIM